MKTDLAKVGVGGSNPLARSSFRQLKKRKRPRSGAAFAWRNCQALPRPPTRASPTRG
jgi:hypothetical protein